MRRVVSSTGITLFALFMSGWGSVLAAVCPHAGVNPPQAAAEDHSCHRAKIEEAGAHHSSSHHGIAHRTKASPVAGHLLDGGETATAAVGQPAGTCAHCVGQNELPATPASVRELTLQKRDAGKLIEQTATTPARFIAVSLSQFTPTQHAPPGLAGRKHLLLSVFLI